MAVPLREHDYNRLDCGCRVGTRWVAYCEEHGFGPAAVKLLRWLVYEDALRDAITAAPVLDSERRGARLVSEALRMLRVVDADLARQRAALAAVGAPW